VAKLVITIEYRCYWLRRGILVRTGLPQNSERH